MFFLFGPISKLVRALEDDATVRAIVVSLLASRVYSEHRSAKFGSCIPS